MLQSLDSQLSAMDCIRSPLDVPMPTQSEVMPEVPLGVSGRSSVDVASRIHEPPPTGPVLKAGPIAARADVVNVAAAARAERAWRENGILMIATSD